MLKSVGLIGYGYWGKKIARVLKELHVLWGICDVSQESLNSAHELLHAKYLYSDLVDFINSGSGEVDSIVIATPPESHSEIAELALRKGLHTFVEKPLAIDSDHAKRLIERAKATGLSLKVGHIYLHNPGLMAIPVPVGRCELYIKLLNPAGPPGQDKSRDIWWAALPHAISLLLHFLPGCDKGTKILVFGGGTRIKLKVELWDGSQAFIDVGDYTGVRMRDVELRVGNLQYQFTADRPNGHIEVSSGKEWTHYSVPDDPYPIPTDPLTLEMKDFLKGEGVDELGIGVVELIEQLRAGWIVNLPQKPDTKKVRK